MNLYKLTPGYWRRRRRFHKYGQVVAGMFLPKGQLVFLGPDYRAYALRPPDSGYSLVLSESIPEGFDVCPIVDLLLVADRDKDAPDGPHPRG